VIRRQSSELREDDGGDGVADVLGRAEDGDAEVAGDDVEEDVDGHPEGGDGGDHHEDPAERAERAVEADHGSASVRARRP
jgi:hypothetical protein